jgi:hypothetical protein
LDRPRPLVCGLFVCAPVGFLLEARLVPELVETGRERLTRCRRPSSSEAERAAPGGSTADAPARRRPSPLWSGAGRLRHEIPVEVLGPDGDEGAGRPSYDQLAASQVVARLAVWTTELAEIEAYEQAHRKRRTVRQDQPAAPA